MSKKIGTKKQERCQARLTERDMKSKINNWKDILDALPDMCFVVSSEGKLVEVNRQASRTLGRSRESLLDLPFISFLGQSFQQEFQAILHRSAIEGLGSNYEAQLVDYDGKVVHVLLFVSRYPVKQNQQQSQCLIVARDISEEKKKELDFLRFYNLAHYTVNPLEITDVDGRIIYVNPAFEKASGYSKEELIGTNPSVFGSKKHPKSFWNNMWTTISSGKVWVGEVENRRRSGEPFFTQLLVSPIVHSDGEVVGYFGIHRDISEQKYLEQQLIHAQKMESIGMLAAGIAHEVGNPLTSISSLVQVIQRTTKDEFINEKLELIKSQVIRISRIIRDLVDFSRRSDYEVQLTDVNKRVREAVEIVRVGKKAKEIFFQVDLDESVPPLPLVPDQIEQVFINILINAVDAIYNDPDVKRKFADGNSQRQISVESSIEFGRLVVIIKDNGKGIPEKDLPKVFEPFFTTKKVGEGTGLGLWVSYGIIKSFQGVIKVKSKEGQGTIFTISLPLHPEFSKES